MKGKLGTVQDMLGALSPEQQAFAQDYAKLRVEVKMLKTALSGSQKQFAELYAFILAILRQMPDHEIRFSREDFESYQMFKEGWELLSEYVAESNEQVLRLRYRGDGDAAVRGGAELAGGSKGKAE